MTHRLARVAFLFPGQGSQTVGMGRELAAMYPVAQHTFDEADEALGYKLSELCFEGPEDRLRMTEVTQPAILTVSVACYRVLESIGLLPSFVAGHSLGEYSAHVAAGTISFADAVRTVRNRGKYMQEAVPAGQGAMAAILGLPADQVRAACEEAAAQAGASHSGAASSSGENGRDSVTAGDVCQPANINSPDQVVISGSKAAVERAAELCKQKGAKRAVMLPVSAPFHCALMQPAQDRLAVDLQALQFDDTAVPVICNVDAVPVTTAVAARQALIRQVTGAVRWDESIRNLISSGIGDFVEVGPGKVLTGLMRQIDRTPHATNVEDEASLQKTKNHFAESTSKPE